MLTHDDVTKIMVDATPGLIDVMADYFEEAMPDIAKKALQEIAPRELHITTPSKEVRVIPRAHKMLETVVQALQAGVYPFLVGPAGSGKTTLAKQCATALDLPFGMIARASHKTDLFGYKGLDGVYHDTVFRRIYEKGGVMLFDEISCGEADVTTLLNAPMANGFVDFPDGMVEQSPDCYFIWADNTYGRGGDRTYVGRNEMDGSTLDRVVTYEIGYDEALEDELAQHPEWVARVRQVRKAVEQENLRYIVSPRASMFGAKLLRVGQPWKQVEESVIFKGMDKAGRARVENRIARGY